MSAQYYLQKANILIRKAPSIIYPTPPLSLLIAPAVPPLNSVLGVWNRGKLRYLGGSGVNFWLLFTWLLKVLSDIWFWFTFLLHSMTRQNRIFDNYSWRRRSWHNVWVLSEFLLVILASFCSSFSATFCHSRVETWPNAFSVSWDSVWSLYFNYELRKANKRRIWRAGGWRDGRKRTEVFIKTISSN